MEESQLPAIVSSKRATIVQPFLLFRSFICERPTAVCGQKI
jgi:hypothetical protein